ncbi:MAG: TolC family protein [Rikenellaceae bacterium]
MGRYIILIVLFMGSVAHTSAMELTLDSAIELALSDNPTVKIADLEVERYDYVRKTTMSALLPQLSVDGTLDRTLKNQALAEGFSLGENQYNTFAASGSLSMALYAPTVYRTLKMNQSEAEAAVEAARSTKIDLVAAVKSSYYAVLLAEQSLEVLLASSQTAKESVEETQVKYNNGISSEYDLLTAQVQYSNLQPTIMQTRSSIGIAKDLLKMYLSLPQSVEVELSGDIVALHRSMNIDVERLSRDLAGNSSLRSLTISQDILQHQLRINNASRLPVLAAYGQITYTGNNMGSFSLTGTSASDGYFWQSPASVGLTLSFPLFDGGGRVMRSRQIENQINQLELQRAYTEQSVSVSLSTAISDIYTAQEMVEAQRITVAQARKAYDITNTRYGAGAGTILELNTARLSMTQAELNLLQALYDLLVAQSEYDRIVGVE